MLRSILVGLDGFACSDSAVDLGIEWAKRLNALVIGLGIVDEPGIRRPELVSIGGGSFKQERDASLLEEARDRIAQCLDRFVQRCEAADVAHHHLKDVGTAYEEILRESQRYDVILLGRQTQFRPGVEQASDHTLRLVLRHAPTRPVVSVPEHPEAGSGVLIAYDGRREADLALQAFCTSGLDFGEEVHVLCMNADANRASRCAHHAAEFLQLHGIHANARPMKPLQSVAKGILEQVRQRNVRLLVMGAYGRSMMREFLLGSTTATVLHDCPVPAFLCH